MPKSNPQKANESLPEAATAPLTVDQTPHLKKALTRCRRVATQLKNRRTEIEQFETRDEPAYSKWLKQHFDREQREAIAILNQMHGAMVWVQAIDRAQQEKGVPDEEVYEYVRRHLEDPSYRHPVYDNTDDADEDAAEPPEDEVEAFFKELMEGLGIEPGDADEEPGDSMVSKASAKDRQREIEIKQLYRKLARRLHPDSRNYTGSEASQHWEALQAAYERGDLEKMQTIEVLCDADESGLSIDLGLSRLTDWANHFQAELSAIQADLKAAKKHPSWKFSSKTAEELKRLHTRTQAEIEDEICSFSEMLDDLQFRVEYYKCIGEVFRPTRRRKRAAPKKKAAAKKKRSSANGN